MVYHDTPDQIIGYFIITVNYPVTGTNNFLNVIKLEILVLFKYPICCFANYFQITLNRPFCPNVRNILFKNSWIVTIIAINLVD